MFQNSKLKIGFISKYALNDQAAASGSFYSMAQALEKYCGEVVPLAPLHIPARRTRRIVKGIMVYLLRKNWDYERTEYVSGSYARQIGKLLRTADADILFAPMGSILAANLKTNLPIVLLGDATYAAMLNFYAGFTNLFRRHITVGNLIEKKALERADLILYASDWAADSAIRDYGINADKIRIIPLGANLAEAPSQREVETREKQEACTLLFLAVDWERKGGEVVLETFFELVRIGLKTRLMICGCQPKNKVIHAGITFVPFLNKNKPDDRKKLEQILRQVDFLLLPSRAEAYGVVIAEANAFGIPALATNVGGIPGAIRDGENGFLFPLSARGSDYARTISKTFCDEYAYRELRREARKAYEERLNWRSWAFSVRQAFSGVLGMELPELAADTPAAVKHG